MRQRDRTRLMALAESARLIWGVKPPIVPKCEEDLRVLADLAMYRRMNDSRIPTPVPAVKEEPAKKGKLYNPRLAGEPIRQKGYRGAGTPVEVVFKKNVFGPPPNARKKPSNDAKKLLQCTRKSLGPAKKEGVKKDNHRIPASCVGKAVDSIVKKIHAEGGKPLLYDDGECRDTRTVSVNRTPYKWGI